MLSNFTNEEKIIQRIKNQREFNYIEFLKKANQKPNQKMKF